MSERPREFDLIERIRHRAVARDDVLLGIGDDAALLAVPAGRHLVVAMDTLNAGVHFPPDTRAGDIGWKALAVNLSDLAAMGATPAWCTLSLSMPSADAVWLDGFIDGFSELARAHRVALVGGDTTRGPLSICVTVHGLIEPGRALRRDGARVGDDIWVSGTLGDAAAALSLRGYGPMQASSAASRSSAEALVPRLDRPTPRLALGARLAAGASACIDISDGLLADLGHVARASGVSACIEVDRLPSSSALREAFGREQLRELQACGGDDYELCFTADPALAADVAVIGRETNTPVTRVGKIAEGAGVRAIDAQACAWKPARAGYEHFGQRGCDQ